MEEIFITRDGEVKLRFRRREVSERADGTLWCGGVPILGITDPTQKAAAVTAIKKKQFDTIPAEAYVRFGENSNGLWAGTAKDWETHPAKIERDKKKAEHVAKDKQIVSVELSSRGWGDYSPVVWRGDIMRPDAEILSECRAALTRGHDVDFANQSDADILAKISSARTKLQNKADAEQAEKDRMNALLAKAKETGEKQVVKTWMTSRCMGKASDCSFDSATEYATPDGEIRIEYRHCH